MEGEAILRCVVTVGGIGGLAFLLLLLYSLCVVAADADDREGLRDG